MDELSTSFQNLGLSKETYSDPFKCLKKDSIKQFKLCNSDEWQTVTLKSRSRKVTGKYKNAWSTIATDGTEKSIDFDRDVQIYKIKQKRDGSDPDEIHFSET